MKKSILIFAVVFGMNAIAQTMIKDINSGAGGSNPNYFTNFNGSLFFQANDGFNGTQLWKSGDKIILMC